MASGLLQIGHKSENLTWRHFQFFGGLFCFSCQVVNISYWSKFHVNNITCSRVMTIFCYKDLTRNPEIKNTPVWVFKLTGVFGISVLHSTISLVTLLGLINVNESHFDWYMLVSIYCFKSTAHMYRNFLRHHPIGGCLCYLIENVPRSNLCKESILFIVK